MRKKKPNTRVKGRKNEKKAFDILIGLGYDVQIAPMPSKFSKQNDLWGLWDLVAVDDEEVRFVQVKSNTKIYGKQREKYASFVCPSNCTKEIWSFYDRKPEPFIDIL